jgi:hypothetical protein
MPATGWVFIGLMAMAMMVILAGVVGNAVVAASIAGGSTDLLAQSESYAIWFEAVRRVGVALYLVAIALGLATIIEPSVSRPSACGSCRPSGPPEPSRPPVGGALLRRRPLPRRGRDPAHIRRRHPTRIVRSTKGT